MSNVECKLIFGLLFVVFGDGLFYAEVAFYFYNEVHDFFEYNIRIYLDSLLLFIARVCFMAGSEAILWYSSVSQPTRAILPNSSACIPQP